MGRRGAERWFGLGRNGYLLFGAGHYTMNKGRNGGEIMAMAGGGQFDAGEGI
jgi:hypothetical protein